MAGRALSRPLSAPGSSATGEPVPWRRLAFVGGTSTGTQAGTVIYPPGSTHGPVLQASYQLILQHRGEAVTVRDDDPMRLAPGQVALLTPGHRVLIKMAADQEVRFSWVSVRQPALSAAQSTALEAGPLSLPISPCLAHLMETILALPESVHATEPALVALGSAALVVYLEEARSLGLAGEAVREHPAVTAARHLIRRHLDQRFSLTEIAEAVHVAPNYLIKLFRQALDTTPMRYVWAERVRLGIHLLEHTGLPVADVAAQVGYQTPKHFSRAVHTITGLSPRDVRRRSRADLL